MCSRLAGAMPSSGAIGPVITLGTDSEARLSRETSGSPGSISNTRACSRASASGSRTIRAGRPISRPA